ncbi:MAG: hypothetical protein M3472_07770 [Chloroflexota bacterium]|jgi:hypothetical protein|nr:hypothetical protein [Pseudonocardiales bacterium]MDQ3408031.1 hypothetical protein [Chloroflexota bacterium]
MEVCASMRASAGSPAPTRRGARRRLAVFGAALLFAAGCAVGEGAQPGTSSPVEEITTSPPAPPPPPELPRGGRQLLPTFRLMGFSGEPNAAALGRLTGDLTAAGAELELQAVAYAGERPILPVFELIATVVQADPGSDGLYRTRASDETIMRYLQAARAARGILLLNIQPGLADFLPEVAAYQRWLTEPDVGVALDPEWAIDPGEVPGEVFGSTTGAELDAVARYLAELVREGDLPQKAMVYHQVAPSVVADEQALGAYPEVALVKSVDGIGTPAMKIETWTRLMAGKPPHVWPGFKLFYDEDTRTGPLMTPPEVLALTPTPDYVLYE